MPLLLDRCQDRDASPRVKAIIALRLIPVDPQDVPKVVDALARRVSPTDESQAIVRYEDGTKDIVPLNSIELGRPEP